MKRFFLSGFIILFLLSNIQAQAPQTEFRGFGHVEYSVDFRDPKKPQSYYILGEHDLFVQSKISKRFSFLGEFVIRYNKTSSTKFLPSIERAFAKYSYMNNHSVIVGKIHTPVNYWNDTYHHGRVFFPVIDRPFSFSNYIPLHTIGLQFQGQNLGALNFGYDVVIGNGIASTDVFDDNKFPSLTAAFHCKPIEGMRIGASYYIDKMDENGYGSHSGHPMPVNSTYTGPVLFQLVSFSAAYFGPNIEVLSESSYNATRTDSLGTANNFSSFAYVGYRIKEKHIPFVVMDYINIANNELHSTPMEMLKLGIGYRHEFSHLINVKGMVEYYSQHHMGATTNDNYFAVEVQVAYGF